MLSNNQQAFLALVRAGLWETEVRLSQYEPIDFKEVYRLAQEQAVAGLVAAGLERVVDINVPKEDVLTFVGEMLQLEQRNTTMNYFIGILVEKMRSVGIYTLLVKGQGVAQCYEKPLWRACGDIDFFLSEDNYFKAIQYLRPLASKIEGEESFKKHLALTIESWEVELHGTLRCGLWKSLDKTLDDVQNEIICGGAVRSWMNDNTQVFLPRADEDVLYVFSHILQHYFKEGVGLRQICDWCRLLWKYKAIIKQRLLESRIRTMGAMTEWKSLAALAVCYLGMPENSMPFYSGEGKWEKKAKRIMDFIFETGNFGHNRDYSYYNSSSYLKYKAITFWKHSLDSIKYFFVFPKDSVVLWFRMLKEGLVYVAKKK